MNRTSHVRVASWAISALIASCLLLAFSGWSAHAQTGATIDSTWTDAPTAAPLERMLTVKFDDSATRRDRYRALNAADADFEQALAAPGLQQVSVPQDNSIAETAMSLRANPKVEFVEEPGHWQAAGAPPDPNDSYFWTQWGLSNTGGYFACEKYTGPSIDPFCPAVNTRPVGGLPNADINAPEAWNIATTGSEPVAVVDTGVAYQHQDLAANIYQNTAEINGLPGIDDDGNGLVDDFHGWDFTGDLQTTPAVDDPNTPGIDESKGPPTLIRLPPDNDPRDPDGHGTHVSSIIGADTNNNKGVAGVDPRAQLMPLRAADETGSFTWAAINEAVTYAIQKGVRIVNGSFGGADSDSGLETIIANNPGVLFIFSAGNGGSDHIGDNHDAVGGRHEFPCDIPADNIICVAATDWNDKLAKFSDFGYDSVDVAAPGAAIFGAIPGSDGLNGGIGDFKFLDGTSMAAPMVSGAAALIWGANPTLEASQIKTLLVENTDQLLSLSGKVGFGGRLDVAKAAAAAANPPAPGWPVTPPPPPPGPGTGGTDGGPTGSTGPVTTPDQVPTGPTIDTTAPAFDVVTPKSVRVGALGKIRFRVHCKEACSVKVLARADVAGMGALKLRATVRANRSRTLFVQFTGKRLRTVRSLLNQGQSVKVYFSVIVSDKAGNHSIPRIFTVKLSR